MPGMGTCQAPSQYATAKSPCETSREVHPPTARLLPQVVAQIACMPTPAPVPNVDHDEPSHMASYADWSICPPPATRLKSPTATRRSFHTVAASICRSTPVMPGVHASRSGAHVEPLYTAPGSASLV